LNCYLDTSALVKLYVDEAGSRRMKGIVAEASLVGTSLLAYLEARSAFARRYREGDLTAPGYHIIVEAFAYEWERYFAVRVDEAVLKAAVFLSEKNALKALDALHLASAMALVESTGMPWMFLAADLRLVRAAIAEGLETIDIGS